MEQKIAYILMGVVALLIIILLLFWVRSKGPKKGMSRLAYLSFIFIFAGLIFNQDGFIGYGLMTFGGILAIIDIARKLKNKN
jgi:hypothetical protein